MVDEEKINHDLLKLRQRLHDSYGLFCDMTLVSHLLTEMLREKQGKEILGVVGDYSKEELLAAVEANAEFEKIGAEEPADLVDFQNPEGYGMPVRRKPGRPKKKPDA